MKRLVAALAILLGIATLCFFSVRSVRKIAEKNLLILNDEIRLQESPDWLSLSQKQEELEQNFKKDQKFLHFFVGRNKIEELRNTLHESRYFLEIQQQEELFHHYTTLRSLWKTVLEEQKVSIRTFA